MIYFSILVGLEYELAMKMIEICFVKYARNPGKQLW